MDTSYFHNISENQFTNTNIEIKDLNKSDFLFREEDALDFIYFLLDGEVNIIKDNQMLWQASQNEFIGISSFFNKQKNYAFSVKACQKSRVLVIPINEFKNALEKSASLNNTLMLLFCDRIKLTHAKITAFSNLSKRKRLIKVLIDKAKKISLEDKIILNYTSLDLAEFINIPHNFVKKTLLELQNKKLIKLKKESVEVLDFNGLKLVLQMKIV